MLLSVNSLFRNNLLLLLAMYFAQGLLYPTGGIIGKVSLLGVFLISTYYCAKSLLLQAPKPLIYYSFLLLLIFNLLGFLASDDYGGIHFSQMRNILTAILPFFAFYYLAKKGCLKEKNLLFFFLLMLPIAVAKFFHSETILMLELKGADEDIVNNVAYLFVPLIPFVFFWRGNKFFAFSSLLILIFFIIQSAKRGALITGGVGVMVFACYQFMNAAPNRRARGYVIALVGAAIILFSAIYFVEKNEFLVHRMQALSEGGGSGRHGIYTNLFLSWYNSRDVLVYLFGFGFVATIDKSGTGSLAHSDWLELLTNFGLFGVIVYSLAFLSVGRYILDSKISKTYRFVMAATAFMWLLQSLFSMYYTASSTAIAMAVLGYLIGVRNINQINQVTKRQVYQIEKRYGKTKSRLIRA